ncbi:MAG: hypothetical protein AAB458_00030 [Patescibacteria group bacterium]
MGWIGSAFFALLFWSLLYVFSAKAAPNGGEINLLLETVSVLVVVIFLSRNITSEMISKVTVGTCLSGLFAGLMYGVGTYFFFMALQKGPSHVGEIALITGMNPIAGLLIIVVVSKYLPRFLTEMHSLRPVQWSGILLGGIALLLINWDPKWSLAFSKVLGR